MKKLITILTIIIMVTTPLFALSKNIDTPITNRTLNGIDISTTLYYNDSKNLVLNQDNLEGDFSKITKPFYLKANGNVSIGTTIYIALSSEYFHNSVSTSLIKPKVYLIKNQEMAEYNSIGEYTSIENDPTISNNSIVKDETNTHKGKALKSNSSLLDALFSITLPHANHMNDTVLVFALTWDTQTYLYTDNYKSNITLAYFSDL